MTNGEIFRKAAEYIREYGWQQEGIGVLGGPRCVLGALCVPTMGDLNWNGDNYGTLSHEVLEAASTLARRVGINVPNGEGWRVWHWNDKSGRTKEQVIATLDDLAFDEDLKAAATAPA